MIRVERDRYGDWIARDGGGSDYPENGFRWRTRAGARCAAAEARFYERAASGIAAPSGGGTPKSGPTEGKSPTAESGDAQ